MPQLTVEIPNLERLTQALKRYPKIAVPILQKAIVKSIYDIQGKTVPLTPIKTGRLRGSFQTAFSALQGILRPTVGYALFVHEGTSPHVIRPVSGKALYWKGADHPVASVNHPGTKPNRFMAAGLEASKQQVIDNFSKALNDITRSIAAAI